MMKRIKEICKKYESCENCPLVDDYEDHEECCVTDVPPSKWIISEIIERLRGERNGEEKDLY